MDVFDPSQSGCIGFLLLLVDHQCYLSQYLKFLAIWVNTCVVSFCSMIKFCLVGTISAISFAV